MKQIIWSSDALLDETAREYYQNDTPIPSNLN